MLLNFSNLECCQWLLLKGQTSALQRPTSNSISLDKNPLRPLPLDERKRALWSFVFWLGRVFATNSQSSAKLWTNVLKKTSIDLPCPFGSRSSSMSRYILIKHSYTPVLKLRTIRWTFTGSIPWWTICWQRLVPTAAFVTSLSSSSQPCL